jgi:hypothetical protein
MYDDIQSNRLPATTLSGAEVIHALRQAIASAGTASAFAAQAGLSAQYVADVLAGRRQPADRLLAALGLRRITVIAAEEDIRS